MANKAPGIATILLVWLNSLIAIFILPGTTILEQYLLASAATALTVVFLAYSRRDKVTKRNLQHVLYGLQMFFFLHVPYLFWSLGAALWQPPPIVNGFTVVTWLGLYIVVMDIVGIASLFQGIVVGWNWFKWTKGP